MTSTYLDRLSGVEASVAIKAPVLVASTANLTLSGEQTIDGVAVEAGDRVLVKDQTDPIDNGIWDASLGSWSRSDDFNGSRDAVQGTQVIVLSGTVNAMIRFMLDTADPVIGVTSLEFVNAETQFNWRGNWANATNYSIGDVVHYLGSAYICTLAHTSSVLTYPTVATDRWELLVSQGDAGGGTGDLLAANNLSDVDDAATALSNIGGQPLDSTLTDFGAADGGGTHTMWIPASSFIPTTTNGAAYASQELATNDVMVSGYDFDAGTIEKIQFMVAMPKSWNEGTLSARFVWKDAATAGSGDVRWGIRLLAVGDDDAIDAAFGTERYALDTFLASGDLHITGPTADITPSGTPAERDLVVIEVFRDATSGADTYAQDARFIGLRLTYTTDTWNDN